MGCQKATVGEFDLPYLSHKYANQDAVAIIFPESCPFVGPSVQQLASFCFKNCLENFFYWPLQHLIEIPVNLQYLDLHQCPTLLVSHAFTSNLIFSQYSSIPVLELIAPKNADTI